MQGKAALAAAAEAACGLSAIPSLPRPEQDAYLVRLSRRAMACTFEIFFNAGQYAHDTEMALAALDLVDQLEEQLSVFRPDSEVSRLNRRAAEEPVVLESRLFGLIEEAVAIHAETDGAYDITAGPLSAVWGFTRRAGAIPQGDALAAAQACVGSRYLELNRAACSVRFLTTGVEINLGSIGKGYALDRCAELLAAAGIENFLLHGGNSSVLGRGAHAAQASEGWSIGVRNPLHPDRRLGQLWLRNRALATSGSGTQFFVHLGRRYGHILDPRSGWPADGVLSVSVLAPSAARADALSTAFYVMGPAPTEAYCHEHPEVSAVVVCPGERGGGVQLALLNLAPGDWTSIDEA